MRHAAGTQARARGAGDGRLQRWLQVQVVLSHTLERDEGHARAALLALRSSLSTSQDHGLALGAARLLTRVAVLVDTRRGDPVAADLARTLALDLYADADAPIERSTPLVQRAESLEEVGALDRAESLLTQELARLSQADQCQAPGLTWPSIVLSQRFAVLHTLTTLHGARRDAKRLAEDRQVLAMLIAAAQVSLGAASDATAPGLQRRDRERIVAIDARLAALRGQIAKAGQSIAAREALWLESTRLFDERRGLSAREALYLQWSAARGVDRGLALQLAQLSDREDMRTDPLLPRERWFDRWWQETLRQQRSDRPQVEALRAHLRGDDEAARGAWPPVACAPQASVMPADRVAALMQQDTISAALHEADLRILLADGEGAAAALCRAEAAQGITGTAWAEETRTPWVALMRYAQVASLRGQHKEALALAQQALALVDRSRGGVFDERLRQASADERGRSEVHEVAVEVAARAVQATSDPALRRAAVQQVFLGMEKARARVLQDTLGVAAQPQFAELSHIAQRINLLSLALAERRCARLQAAPAPAPSTEPCARLRSDLARANRDYDAAQQRLPAAQRALVSAAVEDAAAVSARLPASVALLSYMVTSRALVIVVLRRQQEPLVVLLDQEPLSPDASSPRPQRLPFSAHRLSALVEGAFNSLSVGVTWPEDQQAALRALLLEPLREVLATAELRELVVVPQGVLRRGRMELVADLGEER